MHICVSAYFLKKSQPNVGAAGCTLKVGAAGCTLTSGQPGAAWSGQEVCLGFALAARAALRSRLGLCPRGLLYELVQYNLCKTKTNLCGNTICICMNLYYIICIKNVQNMVCINLYKN
jgi:hypothetical protein